MVLPVIQHSDDRSVRQGSKEKWPARKAEHRGCAGVGQRPVCAPAALITRTCRRCRRHRRRVTHIPPMPPRLAPRSHPKMISFMKYSRTASEP